MVDSKEETIALDDETKENETSAYYPHFSTEEKEVVKSLSPDENNPLEIPEESSTNAVFYQQYNEATIGKSEDTVSEPIQDSDFNDPSHISKTIIPDEESCNADTCIEKNNSADVKENSEDQLKKEEIFCDPCLHGDLKSKATLFCKTCDVPEPLCADCGV